jgi:hypothetical protein
LVLCLNNKFKFNDELGINPSQFEDYKNYLKEDVVDNVKKGVDSKSRLKGSQDEELMETLFFYHSLGLNNLAYKIHQNL